LIETEYNFDNDMGSYSSDIKYVCHEEKFTSAKFSELCKMALHELKVEERTHSKETVAEKMIELYGFKRLETAASYEFELV
jgi:hypothetical protein